jgi:ABC-type lipoprotein release transport system permease subunit
VLYRVDPQDPVVIATVIVLLAVTSLVASFLPARRATRIDPMVVLSGE